MRASLKGLARNTLNILLEWTNILKPECGQKLNCHFMTNAIPYPKITLLFRTVTPCIHFLPSLPYLWPVLFSFFKLLPLRINDTVDFWNFPTCALLREILLSHIFKTFMWFLSALRFEGTVRVPTCMCVCECVWVWVSISELTDASESKVLCAYLKFIKSPPPSFSPKLQGLE